MKLVDLNILLYAVNADSVHHKAASSWLTEVFAGEEAIVLPWVVILGFLRISTSARVFATPLTAEQAVEVVDDWLALPSVILLNPGDSHWNTLRGLLTESGTAANLTTDAHLAALAIDNGCELCSTDNDFGRFRYLKWRNPLAAQVG